MKTVFNMKRKVKCIGELPPNIMLNMFDALIKPILIYGSYVWGIKSELWGEADKIFLRYIRCILWVTSSTCNVMNTWECGRFLSSTACQISVLCFTNRLHHMSNYKLVKKVYCDLVELNGQGLTTRATDALKLVNNLGLDLNDVQKTFEINCKHVVQSNYIATWFANLHDIQSNPILRTYGMMKYEYPNGTISIYHNIVLQLRNYNAAHTYWNSIGVEIPIIKHILPTEIALYAMKLNMKDILSWIGLSTKQKGKGSSWKYHQYIASSFMTRNRHLHFET